MSSRIPQSAMLIIDVQNDFCPGGSLEVQEGDSIVPVINRIIHKFSKTAATQDWHPGNHISFASNHPEKKPFDVIQLKYGDQVLWPDHCVQGSPGAELHKDIDTKRIDIIIRKGSSRDLDSYSAFFENDRKTSTGLSYYLKGLNLNKLFLTGLATDVCVYFSAMDAIRLGFDVFLITDAARGINTPPGSLDIRLDEMRRAGIRLISSTDLDRWRDLT